MYSLVGQAWSKHQLQCSWYLSPPLKAKGCVWCNNGFRSHVQHVSHDRGYIFHIRQVLSDYA